MAFAPLLIVGLLNIPAWYGLAYWGLNRWLGYALLLLLAVCAGWFATEKPWGVVLVMITPTLFIGGGRHGCSWAALVYGLRFPPLLRYFLWNMTPVIVAYSLMIGIGRFARFKVRHARLSNSTPRA